MKKAEELELFMAGITNFLIGDEGYQLGEVKQESDNAIKFIFYTNGIICEVLKTEEYAEVEIIDIHSGIMRAKYKYPLLDYSFICEKLYDFRKKCWERHGQDVSYRDFIYFLRTIFFASENNNFVQTRLPLKCGHELIARTDSQEDTCTRLFKCWLSKDGEILNDEPALFVDNTFLNLVADLIACDSEVAFELIWDNATTLSKEDWL